MSTIARFAAYAAEFEEAYKSDDWSILEPFFTEDAVYDADLPAPLGGRFEGRAAILEYFKFVLDRFDRRFASREIALIEGPKLRDDSVWIRGSATYKADGLPDFTFELEESVTFDGDRISRLHDAYEPEVIEAITRYLDEHGAKIGVSMEA